MTPWALQQAIYARLSAVVSVAVYDHTPQDVAFPYVVIGEDDTVIPFDTDDSVGAESTINIHVWSRYRGWKEVKEIQREVYQALHRYELSVTGAHVVTVEFDDARTFLDQDGLTRHGVTRFRIITEET